MHRDMNVLLITVDTVRPDHLGCYGYGRDISPNIDQVAERGWVFHQAISNGSYTKPAFPPILSSTYASMYGGPFAEVGKQRPMLAALLQRGGLRTAGFTTNPLLGAAVGYDEGFDVFEEPVPEGEDRRWTRIKGMQRMLGVPSVHRILGRFGIDTRPPRIYVKGDHITDRACRWLESGRGPFFLWVHYMDAHWPYHTEASLQSPADYAGAWRDMVLMHGAYHEHHPGADVMERVLGMYDEAIAFVDQQIGRLLATLDAMDVRDQTLVAITADHGEEFFEHGRWQHGASRKMYDELLRVPLIVEIPGQPGRVDIPQQVALLDLPVTILDAVGLPSDPRMEGKSLLSARAGQPDPARGVVISEMVALEGLCVALRTEAYKYVYVEQEPHRRELYDLEADPEERDNLYGTRPTVERAFQEILDKHLEQGKRTGSRGEDGQWMHDDEVVRRLRALGYID